MNFYTLDYIVSHQSLDATRRLAAIIVLLVVALAFGALYLRNRVKTRRCQWVVAMSSLNASVGVR